jgi:hypothetical protein
LRERNGPWQIRDAGCHRGIDLPQRHQGFADDLELPLDSGAQHFVCEIFIEVSAGGKSDDPFGGLLRIPKIFGGFIGNHDRVKSARRSASIRRRK